MPRVSEVTRPYFSHDEDARSDQKILKLFFSFRKLAQEMTKEELISFVSLGAYGIFWSILEYMNKNEFKTTDIEILADNLRISEKFVLKVLEDYELFFKIDDCYYSTRLLKNIDMVTEKANARSQAASKRWALSDLKKVYTEIFGNAPILQDDEIDKFIDYYTGIEDFKEKLADILYTTKCLKFDNLPNFDPSINWLLTENHMGKLLNGEYGQLKSWQKHKEYLKQKEKEEQERRKGLSFDEELPVFDTKTAAMEYIADSVKDLKSLNFLPPYSKQLMQQFDITKPELEKLIADRSNDG